MKTKYEKMTKKQQREHDQIHYYTSALRTLKEIEGLSIKITRLERRRSTKMQELTAFVEMSRDPV